MTGVQTCALPIFFKEYVFLVLVASSIGPLVPGGRMMEFDDIDDEWTRKSVLKDVEGCFFVKGVPCFVCKALELCNVVVEVLLLHLEFPELLLGSGFNGSVGVHVGESIEDFVPQVFFGGEYLLLLGLPTILLVLQPNHRYLVL